MEPVDRLFVVAVLLLCLSSAFAFDDSISATTGPSLNVYLSSPSGNLTVVSNNETVPGFRVGSDSYTVSAAVTSSVLYFQVNDSYSSIEPASSTHLAGPIGGYLVLQSFAITSSPSSVCSPFLLLRGQKVTFPFSIGVGESNAIGLELHYNCSEYRVANMTFSIDLFEGPRILFGFDKSTSSNRLGFSVGTFIFVPDVAYNGKVLSDWSPEAHRVTVSAGVLSTPFNFWLSLTGESQRVDSISVYASPDYCHPYFQTGTTSFTVTGQPLLALLVYNCSQNGTTLITMDITLDGGFDPITVVWTKQSGGYREFFMVGTSPFASDVIWWGLTLPLWSDYHFTMTDTIDSTTFYFAMSDAGDTQNIFTPIVSYRPEVTDVKLTGDLVFGGVVDNQAKNFTITYNCRMQATTHIKIVIPMPGYESAVWKWTKVCGHARKDLSIGTKPHSNDVVSAGVATFLFSPTLHTAFVFPDTTSTPFYLNLYPDEDNLNLSSSETMVDNDDATSNSKMALSSPLSGNSDYSKAIIKSLSVNTTHPSCTPFFTGNATVGAEITTFGVLELDLIYNCTGPGDTDISVTLVLEGPYSPILFAWRKRVGKGNVALQIGTIMGYDDVVSGGLPTPLYDPSTFTAFYPTSKLHGMFYAQLNEHYSNQSVCSVTANSSTLWCNPRVHPDPSWNGQFTDYPQAFSVVWNCIVGGPATIMVTFHLANWGPLTIAMTVYSGGPRPYFDIGTMKGAADVVMGGVATPLWIPGPLNGASVSGNVLSTTFWLGMSSEFTSQAISPPFLSFQSQLPIIAPYLTGSMLYGGWVDDTYNNTLTIVYNCSGLGKVPISIGLLLPPYDAITFQWTKICSAQRMGFQVGTNPNWSDVIADGVPSMAWNPETHVAFVNGHEMQTTFYVTELQGSQIVSNLTVNSSMPFCNPYIKGELVPGSLLPEGATANFTVVYNCDNIGDTDILVTLALTGNYMPAAFMWTKRVRGSFGGLNVGTSAGLSDVVYQGHPTFAWDPISHTQLGNQDLKQFYVKVREIPAPLSEIEFLPTVAFTPSPWLLPTAVGPLSNPMSLRAGNETTFAIIPYCLLSTEMLEQYPTVFVAVTAVPFYPSLFAYYVDCPPNVMGLTVGFATSYTDVVLNGIPTPSWSPANASRMQIEADYNILRFWVTSSHGPVPLTSILIAEDGIIITEPLGGSSKKQNIDTFESVGEDVMKTNEVIGRLGYPTLPRPACRAVLSGSLWDSMVVNVTVQLLQLELNCSIGGTNNVSVILVPADPSFSSTVWTFSKTMGGNRHGLGITTRADDFSPETPSTVMFNGVPTEEWNPEAPAALQLPTSSSASFYIQLTNVYFGRDPSQEFFPPKINVSRPDLCFPRLFGNATSGGILDKRIPRSLYVLSNCYGDSSGAPVSMEISIPIPPFTTAVYAWERQSTGIPTYLTVDALLDATKPGSRVTAFKNGVVTQAVDWTSKAFKLWFYLDRSTLPQPILDSGNASLRLLPPIVNTTVSSCPFIVSGNATDGDEIHFDTLLVLNVILAASCNATALEFTVTFQALPFTVPVVLTFAKIPAPPTKPKFPGALVGIIIGTTLLIIGAVSVGLYLCLRRPPMPPSTGAYHLKRRQKERKEEQNALLAGADDEPIN